FAARTCSTVVANSARSLIVFVAGVSVVVVRLNSYRGEIRRVKIEAICNQLYVGDATGVERSATKLDRAGKLSHEKPISQIIVLRPIGNNDGIVNGSEVFARVRAKDSSTALHELSRILRRGKNQGVINRRNIHAFVQTLDSDKQSTQSLELSERCYPMRIWQPAMILRGVEPRVAKASSYGL